MVPAPRSFDLVGIDHCDNGRSRTPPPKGFGPSVGTIVDPERRARYVYESEPERTVLTVFIAQPWVSKIQEQVKVAYLWNGEKRFYTFDVVITQDDDYVVAYAVKSTEADVARGRTEAILEKIAEDLGADFADEYRIVTREGLDPVEVLNANVIVGCARDQDEVGLAYVRTALAKLGPEVTLREVRDASGLGNRGTRAAVALILTGILEVPVGERLCLDVGLVNHAKAA